MPLNTTWNYEEIINQTQNHIESLPSAENATTKSFQKVQRNLILLSTRVCLGTIIMVVGIMANSTVIAVMRRRQFNKLPVQVQFIMLAVFDMTVCLLWGVHKLLRQLLALPMKNIPTVGPVLDYFKYTAMSAAGWYVAYIAVERVLLVLLPHKKRSFSSKKIAMIVGAVIVVTLMLVKSPELWMENWDLPGQQYLPQFKDHFGFVERIITHTIIGGIPMMLASLSYCVLLVAVLKTRKKRAILSRERKLDSFTTAALVILLMYVLFTFPTVIYLPLRAAGKWKFNDLISETIALEFIAGLFALNFSCNFFIYMATNQQFRKEFLNIFRRVQRVQPVGAAMAVAASRPRAKTGIAQGATTNNKSNPEITLIPIPSTSQNTEANQLTLTCNNTEKTPKQKSPIPP